MHGRKAFKPHLVVHEAVRLQAFDNVNGLVAHSALLRLWRHPALFHRAARGSCAVDLGAAVIAVIAV